MTSTPFGPGICRSSTTTFGPRGREPGQRLVAVRGHADDVEAGRLQVALDRVAPHRVVVDHHHPDRLLAHRRPTLVASAAGSGRAGARAVPCRRRAARRRRRRSPGRPARVLLRLQRHGRPGRRVHQPRAPLGPASNVRHPERPAGRGRRTPANASARSRCSQPSSCTTARPVSRSRSARSESGSTSARIRPGSPPATISDDTVSPARSRSAPEVHSVTAPPSRPRSRRTGRARTPARGTGARRGSSRVEPRATRRAGGAR